METLRIDFESLKQEHWSERELTNATLITDFVQHLMNDHNFDYVLQNFNHESYIQHNRSIGDGVPALVDFVKDFARRFPDYAYDVKHIFADGDFIVFHSHATTKEEHRGNDKKGLIMKDTWKLRDGKIVDHWDAIQPLDGFMRFYAWLTGGKIRNANGVF